MQRYKSYVLPVALVLGYFLRHFCAYVSVAVPYVIFGILVFAFSGVKLTSLRPTKLDLWIGLFQTIVSIVLYGVIISLSKDEIIAQGTMMCVLCPVASSVTVVASMLGANPVRTTTYTIVGNLLVTLLVPLYLSLINVGAGVGIGESFMQIFVKVSVVIALPFFIVLLIQRYLPSVNGYISNYKSLSFYLWAFALFVTIGQTADFVAQSWRENIHNVVWLGITSALVCASQFYVGKKIGGKYGDRVAGGQLLAQKNSAMGIWILNTFMNPIASIALAYYSIWQNIFNSWQIYEASRKHQK